MAEPSVDTSTEANQEGHSGNQTIASPARFTLVYESRDGKLCVFEDAHGHLTAVRAETLA